MKVIDLLNKIANDELEDETKFKYDDDYFKYWRGQKQIDRYKDNTYTTVEYYCDELCDIKSLNDEVEIIEEKKIEKLEPLQKDWMTLDDIKFTFSNSEMIIVNKINEIIDYLQSKGKNND